MNAEIDHQLKGLLIALVVALLVWKYYRRRVSTPSDRYSTFGPRFWTGSVDAFVLWPISCITAVALTLDIQRSLAALLVIVQSLAWLLYTVLMHARNGQTVGKMVTKVRVVDFHTEGKISFRQALLREGIPMVLSLGLLGHQVLTILNGSLVPSAISRSGAMAGKPFWLLAALPSLWFVAEALTMLTNEKRRAIHDFIAGTVVVRTNTGEEGAQPPAFSNTVPLVVES